MKKTMLKLLQQEKNWLNSTKKENNDSTNIIDSWKKYESNEKAVTNATVRKSKKEK